MTSFSPDKKKRNHPGGLHLLITDLVLPEMKGRELADQLCSLFPGSKTLFMSTYTANGIAHKGVLEEGVNFIQKPPSFKDLSIKVRATMGKQEQDYSPVNRR